MSRSFIKRGLAILACCLAAIILAWHGAWFSLHGDMSKKDEAVPEESVRSTVVSDRIAEVDADDEASDADDADNVSDQAEASDGSSGEETDTWEEAAEDEDAEPSFVMPEGAEYVSDVVLISVADGATVEEINELLAQTESVREREVTAEELASGVIEVEVAEGSSIEDAVNELAGAEPVKIAQPDYVYHAFVGDESDLIATLGDPLGMDEAPAAPDAVADASSDVDAQDADEQPEGDDVAEGPEESPTIDGGEAEGPSEEAPTDEGVAEGDGTSTGDIQQESGDDAEEAPEQEAADLEASGEDDAEAEEGAPLDTEAEEEAEKGEEDALVALGYEINDPYSGESAQVAYNWSLASIRAYAAWSVARCENTVTIAILDQHPDVSHPDLAANVVDYYDVRPSDDTLSSPEKHGTYVSGVASAVANNNLGVAGVSYNANLMVINVFGSGYTAKTSDLVKAYEYLMAHADELNIRVVNLSLGGKVSDTYSFTDDTLMKQVRKAWSEKGIVTVAAAGNSDVAPVPFRAYPADSEDVVGVINLKRSGDSVTRYTASNYNVPGQRTKNISAPGSAVYSTVLRSSYANDLYGTSIAAPHVSGVLALEFAANPDLSAADAVGILYSTAKDLGDEGWDEQYGYGEVDAFAAVTAAKPLVPVPSPISIESPTEGVSATLSSSSFTYTGESCRPGVTVTHGDRVLVEDQDYTVVYGDNVNAGEGSVTITGKGDYVGYIGLTFDISPAAIAATDVSLSRSTFTYTGKAIKPTVTVKCGGVKLVAGTDYTVKYANNVATGKATVTVTGTGNYTGTVTKQFSIVLPNLSKATVAKIPTQKYTGYAVKPSPTVTLSGKTLVLGRDYTVTYKNNVKVGTATVTIKAKGGFTGTLSTSFAIRQFKGQWIESHGRWWYRWSDGTNPASQLVKIGNATYYFDDDGWMATGWHKISGSWYYFDASGKSCTGWIKDGGYWYYLDRKTKVRKGWLKDGGATYYLDSAGRMRTGWVKVSGSWYYFASSGKMCTGWLSDGGTWYYLRSSGAMATGWVKVGGAWYYLWSSGAMATGWVSDGGTWYYLQSSGAMATSRWIDTYYYVGADGAMATNKVIAGTWYVDANGRWDGKTR